MNSLNYREDGAIMVGAVTETYRLLSHTDYRSHPARRRLWQQYNLVRA